MKKQIVLGALISYITIGVNILAGILYTPWMIAEIGKSNYALYTLALSVISLFMMDFGLSAATSRFLSKYYAEKRETAAQNILSIIFKLYLLIDICLLALFVVLYFFLGNIYVNLNAQELQIFKNLYCVVAFYSLFSFPFLNLNGVLTAKEQFIAIKLCNLAQKLLTILLIVFCLLNGYGVYSLVIVNAFASIFITIVKIILVRKQNVKVNVSYFDFGKMKEIFTFSFWTTISQFAQRCIFNLAPSILAMYVGTVEITFFSLAATLEGYVWMIGDAVNGMFMPKISKLDIEENANEKIMTLLVRVGKFQIILIGLIFFIFLFLGKEFVYFWMGSGYDSVYWCALMIILPSVFDIPQQIAKTTLLVRNKAKIETFVLAVMAVFYLMQTFIFTQKYGVFGMAFSILLAYMLRSVLFSFMYQRVLNLNIFIFVKKVYLKWGIVFCISGIIAKLGLAPFSGLITFPTFFVKALILCLLYLACCYGILLDKEERNNLVEWSKRKLKTGV